MIRIAVIALFAVLLAGCSIRPLTPAERAAAARQSNAMAEAMGEISDMYRKQAEESRARINRRMHCTPDGFGGYNCQ